MTTAQKQEFTRRITQANKAQLIVILYDMAITYLEDAKQFSETKNEDEFERQIQNGAKCIYEMIQNLHYEYSPAKELHAIYLSMRKTLREATAEKRPDLLYPVIKNLTSLREAYASIASLDTSGPVMGNTQTVVAGLTYGKDTITENLVEDSANRGFRV